MNEQVLTQAVELVKSGQKDTARDLLLKIVESDQTNETAWLWLVKTLDNDKQRMRALECCLKFIPDSRHAQRGMEKLRARQKEFVPPAETIRDRSTTEDVRSEKGSPAFMSDEPSGPESVETARSEGEQAEQLEQELSLQTEDEMPSSLEAGSVMSNVVLDDELLVTNPVTIKAEETVLVEEKESLKISPALVQKKRAQRRWIALILGLLGFLVLISVIAGSMILSQYLWPGG